MIRDLLEDIRDALALAFLLGTILCICIARDDSRPTQQQSADETQYAEMVR